MRHQNETVRTIDAFPKRSFDGFTVKPSNKYPCTTRRIDAMLQILHQKRNGSEAPDLTTMQLKSLRRDLKEEARLVKSLMYEHGVVSDASYWQNDVHQVDKDYYAVMLEDRVKQKLDLDIFQCKNKWCAKTLLQETFKAKKQAIARRTKRRQVFQVCNNKDFY